MKVRKHRIKKRAGRKRIEGVVREPNGRARRAKYPRDPFPARTALAARVRHHGLSAGQAADPLSATWIGRLAMAGRQANGISREQYEAAVSFQKIRNDWLKSIEAEGAVYDKIENAGNTEAYTRFCRQAKGEKLPCGHEMRVRGAI